MTVPENPIGGMECDLNGFQSIQYVNGHVDILYSYDVSFAVQYINYGTYRKSWNWQYSVSMILNINRWWIELVIECICIVYYSNI